MKTACRSVFLLFGLPKVSGFESIFNPFQKNQAISHEHDTISHYGRDVQ